MNLEIKYRLKSITKFEWFLILVVLIPYLVIALHNSGTVLDWFTTDDAFYYFQVARNAVTGNGITFDGINRTNGFHPLWMSVCVPIFALAGVDKILPLRVIIILMGVLYAGSGVLLYRLTKRILSDPIAVLVALVWVFSQYLHRVVSVGGMESGINAFFVLLLIERVSAINDRNSLTAKDLREVVGVGAVATLAILSRLDNVFLVLFVGAWFWVRWWNPGEKGSIWENWRWRLQTGFAFFTPVVVVMLLYIGFNLAYFGTWVPVSGQVKVWWGELVWTVYGRPGETRADYYEAFISGDFNTGPWSIVTGPLHQFLDPIWQSWGQGVSLFQESPFRMWGVFGAATGLVLVGLAWPNLKQVSKKVIRMGFIPLALGCVFQISYYKLFGSVGERYWYWIVEDIVLVLGLGLVIEILYLLATGWGEEKLVKRISWSVVLVVGALMMIGYGQNMADKLRPPDYYEQHPYITQAAWLEAKTEPGTWIGMTGSGTTAYFIEGRNVLNLDGLANSYQYFQMMKAGEGADFLDEMGLDYVFGNEYIVATSRPYGKVFEGKLEEIDRFTAGGNIVLWWFDH